MLPPIAFGKDVKPMSSAPVHRLSTKEEAEKIMDKLEKNTDMEDLIQASSLKNHISQ